MDPIRNFNSSEARIPHQLVRAFSITLACVFAAVASPAGFAAEKEPHAIQIAQRNPVIQEATNCAQRFAAGITDLKHDMTASGWNQNITPRPNETDPHRLRAESTILNNGPLRYPGRGDCEAVLNLTLLAPRAHDDPHANYYYPPRGYTITLDDPIENGATYTNDTNMNLQGGTDDFLPPWAWVWFEIDADRKFPDTNRSNNAHEVCYDVINGQIVQDQGSVCTSPYDPNLSAQQGAEYDGSTQAPEKSDGKLMKKNKP
jgi:hypothetical protein